MLPRRSPWSLFASAGIHAAVASVLIAGSHRAPERVSAPPETRDVWIGDTLEMSDPAVSGSDAEEPTPGVTRRTEDATAAPRTVVTKRSQAPRSSSRGSVGGISRPDEAMHVRGFAKAFTRALPAANTGDPVWGELPLGPLGFVRVSVMLDDDGAVAESKVWDKPHKPPSYLARLVDRTLLLLRGGRFALARSARGKATLKLDVTLSERPMETGPLALGFDAPTPGNPGRAYFQLSSGRLVVAKVTIEPD